MIELVNIPYSNGKKEQKSYSYICINHQYIQLFSQKIDRIR